MVRRIPSLAEIRSRHTRGEPSSPTLTEQDRVEIRAQVAAGFKVDRDYHDRAYPITPEYAEELEAFREREKAGFPDCEASRPLALWRTGFATCGLCLREIESGESLCPSCGPIVDPEDW